MFSRQTQFGLLKPLIGVVIRRRYLRGSSFGLDDASYCRRMSQLSSGASLRFGSLLRARVEALTKSGRVFRSDGDVLVQRLESYSLDAALDDFSRFLLPSQRHRFWNMNAPSNTLLSLAGCQDRISTLVDELQKTHSTAAFLTGSIHEMELDDVTQLPVMALEAMEEDQPIVVSCLSMPQTSSSRLIRLARPLGYNDYIIRLPNRSMDTMDFSETDDGVIRGAQVAMHPSSDSEAREMALAILDGQVAHEDVDGGDGRWESLCVFLSARSITDLRRITEMEFDDVSADHLVLMHRPSAQTLGELPPLGSSVRMSVTGVVSDDVSQSAIVTIEGPLRRHPLILKPHRVTLSQRRDAKTLTSNGASHREALHERLDLDGTLGLFVFRGPHRPLHKVVNRDVLKSETISLDSVPESPHIEVVSKRNEEIRVLHVFDFDGTLMSSPDEVVGKQEYESVMGVPYPHHGWWGRLESLQSPVRVLPGPALRDCRRHFGRSGSWSVVLTGRLKRVRSAIEDVLKHYGVDYDELICKGGYSDTQRFKIKTIADFIRRFENLQTIKIWEDNVENLAAMYDLKKTLSGRVDVEIIEAPVMPPPGSLRDRFLSWERRTDMRGVAGYLEAVGKLPEHLHWLHAERGIETIVESWRRALGIDCFLNDLFFVVGGYGFGIRGVIDVRLLAPSQLSLDACTSRLGERLRASDMEWSTGDGLMVVHLVFSECCPMTYRLRFLRMNDDAFGMALTSASELRKYVDDEDNQSTVEMRMTMERIHQAVKTKEEVTRIRSALALADQLLDMHHASTDLSFFHLTCQMDAFLNLESGPECSTVDAFSTAFLQYLTQKPEHSKPAGHLCKTTPQTITDIQSMTEAIEKQLPAEANDLDWMQIHDLVVASRRHSIQNTNNWTHQD